MEDGFDPEYVSKLDELFDLAKQFPYSAILYTLRTTEPDEFKAMLVTALKEVKRHP